MPIIVQLLDDVAIKRFPIEKAVFRIGRDPGSDLFIDDKVVSMDHAVVEIIDDPDVKGVKNYYIKDLNSTNATFVNGNKVTRKKLAHDDTIRIGRNAFKFINEEELVREKTSKIHKSWIPGVFYTEE